METFKLFFFACLTVALLGSIQSGTAVAFDGDDGGFDGGFDDGGDDGGEEAGDGDEAEADDGEQDDHQGEDRDKDKDGRNDAHGHRGHGHRHGHRHHGRGHHTHIIYGWPAFGYGPAFGFGYTPPPYYAYPPGGFRRLVQPPVVHTERKDATERKDTSRPSPEPQTYWYYCRDPEGYYPDVEECPDGWEQVSSRAQEDNQE